MVRWLVDVPQVREAPEHVRRGLRDLDPTAEVSGKFVCATCGCRFDDNGGHRSRERKYCSRACAGTLPIAIVCKGCGVTFTKKRGGSSKTRYCTAECKRSAKNPPDARRMDSYGYWLVRVDRPFADGSGRVGRWAYEQVVVAERVLGRRLKKGEVVHHINGDKTDNRNCNLLVCTHSYHMQLHMRMSLEYQRQHFGSAA